ncbi:MAG: type II and III secretion system protein [Chthoniobacterales bacterium]|nr:type II and III secretion system protein [Chthoniobacterales bacterium]
MSSNIRHGLSVSTNATRFWKPFVPGILAISFLPLSSLPAQNLPALAEREIVRRQEDLLLADKLVAKGDKAMKDREFETAYVSYLDALDKIPDGGNSSSPQRSQIVGKFSGAGIAYAESLVQNGRYGDAEKVAKTILLPQFNPTYKPAVQFLSKLEQPDYVNKTVTPQFAADRDEVVKLLAEADGFYATGRYDLAIKRYEQVLNIDRYNSAARMGMERVNNQKSTYQTEAYNETRSRMLWLVDRAWERPVRRFQGRDTNEGAQSRNISGSNTEAIAAKLNRIIVPKINLQDVTIREAVDLLKQRSRDLDTTSDDPKMKKGVNIVLKLPPPSSAAAAPADPAAPPVEGTTPASVVTEDTRVSLSLNNVPLIEALRYLTELAGLKYKIEPYAVSIVPLTENTDEFLTKEYRVPPGFVPTGTGDASEAAAPTAGRTTIRTQRITGGRDAQGFLEGQGVPFPDGSFAQYVPAGSKLFVRNTQSALDLIDTLVDAAMGVKPTQVEIESKFLEISQNNLKELGFNWLLGPLNIGGGVYGAGGTRGYTRPVDAAYAATYPFGAIGANPATGGLRSGVGNTPDAAVTANSLDALLAGIAPGAVAAAPGIFGLSGIFSNPQFQVVIRALNQKKGVDLMSAPKVTTKAGNKAVIKVVREFPYPTEFSPPEVPPPTTGTTSGGVVGGVVTLTGVVTPTTPTTFETRNLGVTLEVEPQIGADNYTIDLNLVPEVVEFEGFINYGSPIIGPTSTAGIITTFPVTENVINQPIFSVRKVTTSVSIWDGQTVALGGLIREDVQKTQDKVPIIGDIPFAGRLFRSDVSQKIKRNLIIFVTARLMDAEGRPVRQDEEQEEIVEPLGLPENLPPPTFQARSLGK